MNIRISRSDEPKPYPDESDLGFGRFFADHMLLIDYSTEKGWHDARVEAYRPFSVEPANLTLHYGQTIFEGMKAFRWRDGSINLFRLADHVDRFARSATRLCMPAIDPELVAEGIKTLVRTDGNWVPHRPGNALYIRPTMIAYDNLLGVRPAKHYLLYVITSPVGRYYAKGTMPTRILVEEHYTRAAHGGLGEAKTAANYAASLLAAERAKAQGFDQVLWLDANEHRFVEEVGTMNIFFVIDGVLVTPSLDGTILDGITRRSVIQLAQEWGIPCQERPVTMDEIVDAYHTGRLQEAFGSGTAVVISPIAELYYKGESIVVPEPENSLRKRLFKEITGIQYGEIPDRYGWCTRVDEPYTNGAAWKPANGNAEHDHVNGTADEVSHRIDIDIE